MLAGGDADGRLTAVVVGVAKLGEPAVLAAHKDASSFVGTGRALSVAAGRISYVHGLKVTISFRIRFRYSTLWTPAHSSAPAARSALLPAASFTSTASR